MKSRYHIEITRQALQDQFSSQALGQVIHANLGQDSWKYQLNHDHFHFDENAFAQGNAYVEEQRRLTLAAIRQNELPQARAAFGRAIHALQDFYAHSNYVELWRLQHPQAAPGEIDPLVEELLASEKLISGRLYYPLELLYFIPLTQNWVLPRLPADSHARMNKDHPGILNYEFAHAAAVKRTRQFFDALAAELEWAAREMFTKR